MTYEYVVLRVKGAGMYYAAATPHGVTYDINVAEETLTFYRSGRNNDADPVAIYRREKGQRTRVWAKMPEPSEFVCPT